MTTTGIPPLPKAELHLHIEGTLEPETVFELAARNDVALPYRDVEDLRARYEFTDLQSFLDVYYANMAVLRTRADFAELASAYLRRCPGEGVRHVEMFFDPQAHTARGIPIEDVIGGLTDAVDEHAGSVSAGLILCFLRDRPASEAADTLRAAEPHLDRIVGVGLDSAEVGHPPSKFTDVFDRARGLGLKPVAHAGEEGPAGYVREALDELGVLRVDHGIRAVEDDDLVARLRRDGTPLTVCPLSNVRLGCVPGIGLHPLPEMLAAGLKVSVHSDDPAYFGGYADRNYTAVRDGLGLSAEQLRTLAANSMEASFVDAATRDALLAEVAGWRP
ncbi:MULTISPECIES: adenosine deaminase [Pseudonocardia]|uniref:Adenine deaminase n=2 Tax=Pseudonocardia TaxID=1847 RepID=A0A1Y2MRY4_PSEAH|nr:MULTISPECIES: adenosine deaminase [Pseudonocardia]OSY37976.1 Adenine deaminase [Pseudonocardia autotrophica]TDN74637.1 adenosine deaminase [Pseudonocardia autotrophica]BBG05408.1 adenine deaminase [Pseudonocardia autotrophica]GEC26422.1 adenine deaminase [Pseudonocardia saturnea]